MFLSRLTPNVMSRELRRDVSDVHQMHRTVMSAFPHVPQTATEAPARLAHGVLWRLDGGSRGFVQYVQSSTEPDWSALPEGYLTRPAEVRSLRPVVDSIVPGRRFAFRLMANPTRVVHPDGVAKGMRVPHRRLEKQLEWLVRQGERHGFVIPVGRDGTPDVAVSPCPKLVGKRELDNKHRITVEPVRFDGHLVVVDPEALTAALRRGIGRAKAYGCGLLSLAPAGTPDL